jgi:hypothetical protein
VTVATTLIVATLAVTGCTTSDGELADDDPTVSATPSPTPDPTPSPTPDPTPSPTGSTEEVTAELEPVTTTPAGNEVDAVTVVTTGPAGERISASVEELVRDVLADYDARVAEVDLDDVPAPPELEVSATVTRADDRVVSIVFEVYRYLGGASGTTSALSAVYASSHGTELSLADVGVSSADRQPLAAALATVLEERDADAFQTARDVLREQPEELDTWSVSDTSFTLHADAGTLAPMVAGTVSASLPLEEVTALTGFTLP